MQAARMGRLHLGREKLHVDKNGSVRSFPSDKMDANRRGAECGRLPTESRVKPSCLFSPRKTRTSSLGCVSAQSATSFGVHQLHADKN
jgi:hypothetical protein